MKKGGHKQRDVASTPYTYYVRFKGVETSKTRLVKKGGHKQRDVASVIFLTLAKFGLKALILGLPKIIVNKNFWEEEQATTRSCQLSLVIG